MTRYRFILSAVSALFFALSAFAQIDEGDRYCADGTEPRPVQELSIEGIVLDVAAIAFGENYDTGDKESKSAINFFAAGRPTADIPEAKYEDNELKPLPTPKEHD